MADSSAIFLLRDGNALVEMSEQPYATEDALQRLLEAHPRLLSGDLMGHATPRQFVVVSREISLVGEERGVGRIDHVFLDQEGVPTLVEVKRASDTRIRREVVGQMLDYAANAVAYWPVEDVRARFETTSKDRDEDPEERLAPVLGDEGPDAYWARVGANLSAGRLRLLFVADRIPAELRRIIEFLNEQMSRAEVLGLEVKQYLDEASGIRSLVPRIVGITAGSDGKRPTGGGRWDEARFFQKLQERGPVEIAVARRLLDWSGPRFKGTRWGYGKVHGSFYPRLFEGRSGSLFVIATDGRVEVRFGNFKDFPPFDDPAQRERLRSELNAIPGWALPDSIGWPNAPLSSLADDAAFETFTTAMEAAAQRIWAAAGREGA